MVRSWRSSTCDMARRLWLRGRGAGRGVCCRVQWTTRRRTRSRRMINNENTAKQTVAARGMSGDAVRQSEHRRRPHRPRVRRCSRRAENRCTIRKRHPTLIRNCHSNPWWVTSRRSHATTSRDSVNMQSAIRHRVVLRFHSQLYILIRSPLGVKVNFVWQCTELQQVSWNFTVVQSFKAWLNT